MVAVCNCCVKVHFGWILGLSCEWWIVVFVSLVFGLWDCGVLRLIGFGLYFWCWVLTVFAVWLL